MGQGVVGSMGGLCCDSVNSLNVIHSLNILSRSNKYFNDFPFLVRCPKVRQLHYGQ